MGVDFNINIVNDKGTQKFQPQITSGQFKPAGFINDFTPSNFISGLTPATTYYYCALATNAMGTALGAVGAFTTLTTSSSGSATRVTPAGRTICPAVNWVPGPAPSIETINTSGIDSASTRDR